MKSFTLRMSLIALSLVASTQVMASNIKIMSETEERDALLQTELEESREGYGLELNLNRVLADLEGTVDDYRENMSRGGTTNAEEAIRLIAREVVVLIQTIGQGRTGTLSQKGLHRVEVVGQAINPLEGAFIKFVKEVSKKDISVINAGKSNKRVSDKHYSQYADIMTFYGNLAQNLKQAADNSRELLLSAKESWEAKSLKTIDPDEEQEIGSIVAFIDDLIGPINRLYTRIGWTKVSTDAVLGAIAKDEVVKSRFLWFGEKTVLENPTYEEMEASLASLRQAVSETMVAFGMALMEVKDTQMAIDYRAQASKAAFSVFTRLAEKISEETSEDWNYVAHREAMLAQIDEVTIPAAEDLMTTFSISKKEVLRSRRSQSVNQQQDG